MMESNVTQTTQVKQMVRICDDVPVIDETDICVLGGSCTGVFAAVRAARLGARVTLVEKQNYFGGVAAVTCTWHNFLDTRCQKKIIGGVTEETINRLKRRNAVNIFSSDENKGYQFRPGDLKIVLDDFILGLGIRPMLHTFFAAPYLEDGQLAGVVVENKSGRGVIRAAQFIDATGDGDLCSRLGLEQYRYEAMLPPTTCAFIDHWPRSADLDLGDLIWRHGDWYGLVPGFVWSGLLPGTDVCMLAGTRVRGVDCADADDLTRAEMDGRLQVKAIMDMLRAKRPEIKSKLLDFPATIGIRDTRHIKCQYQLSESDVLEGGRFEDAIANGSYRVDTHHQDKPGITFKYLDGRMIDVQPGRPPEQRRWRPVQPNDPTFYQVPLRCLIPGGFENLILAGRMLDADKTAFSAVRVMVNTNQLGEAAGVTAYLALHTGTPVGRVPADDVRATLAYGGSVVI